jgi:hypothetical protein
MFMFNTLAMLSFLEPISKKRLSAHGCVAPPKRNFTSIIMNIKEFVGSAQNAHMIWVEPVEPV